MLNVSKRAERDTGRPGDRANFKGNTYTIRPSLLPKEEMAGGGVAPGAP